MARNSYPETPAQEAARINKASGDPEGITAQQVANNRGINERLTAAFGGGGSTPSAGPGNPFAKLVAGVSKQTETIAADAAAAANASVENFASLKSELSAKVGRLSGEIGTGLNGFTAAAGNLANDAKGALGGVTGAMGGISNTVQSLASNATGVGSALQGLASNATSAISGAAASLGGVAGGLSNAGAAIGASLDKLGLASGGLGGGIASLAKSVSSAAGMVNNLLIKNIQIDIQLYLAIQKYPYLHLQKIMI